MSLFYDIAFANSVWRNWVLAGLAVVGFYKFAPTPGEETYITRWISQYATDKSTWQELNLKHLALSAEGQNDALVVQGAKKSSVLRYRYPQCVALVSLLPLSASLTQM